MVFISSLLTYFGTFQFLYKTAINIHNFNHDDSQFMMFQNLLTRWFIIKKIKIILKRLFFLFYVSIEGIILIFFEILPLGSWLVLMFKGYIISEKSEVTLKSKNNYGFF